MAKRNEILVKRNIAVRLRFQQITQKNPKWRTNAVLDELAKEFYLSNRTIEAIIRGEGQTYNK